MNYPHIERPLHPCNCSTINHCIVLKTLLSLFDGLEVLGVVEYVTAITVRKINHISLGI
jgi:hypothetical protein